MTSQTRLESDNLRRLEDLRKSFDKLRAERIRAEGEVERLTRDLDEARDLAKAELGTSDEVEIKNLIEAALAQNAKLVEEFGTALRDVEARLQQLGDGR
jgi:chromosome segregation ATPase